ncbi:MAG: FKBP-type peptidyl-prolyl cis-trans isomerase [Bacteroidales bacterium]|nr:FKBP-type peptidyl-prolyl cis-trans isomerase [Bacteroidales bacterium]
MRYKIQLFILGLVWLGLTSCQNQPPRPGFFDGYQRTESGLYYQFHTQNYTGENVQIGDVVLAVVDFYWCENRFVTDEMDLFTYWQVDPPRFSGDLAEAFSMMRVGDSASFILPADSVDKHWGIFRGYLNHFCDYFRVTIRIDSIIPYEPCECPFRLAFERQQAEEEEARRAEVLILSSMEQQMLQSHIRRNNITVQPNSDGVFVEVLERGRGRRIRDGNVVVFDYVAWSIDGTILDASCEEIAHYAGVILLWRDYQPKQITVGAREWMVGIDNALRGQRAGSKLRLHMPSSANLGPRGGVFVSTFEPVILEIDILEVR